MKSAAEVQILDETAFHFALMPLGMAHIHQFSLQLGENKTE